MQRNYVLAEQDNLSDINVKMGIVTARRWHMKIKLRRKEKDLAEQESFCQR